MGHGGRWYIRASVYASVTGLPDWCTTAPCQSEPSCCRSCKACRHLRNEPARDHIWRELTASCVTWGQNSMFSRLQLIGKTTSTKCYGRILLERSWKSERAREASPARYRTLTARSGYA